MQLANPKQSIKSIAVRASKVNSFFIFIFSLFSPATSGKAEFIGVDYSSRLITNGGTNS
jgi:hypothetical protein